MRCTFSIIRTWSDSMVLFWHHHWWWWAQLRFTYSLSLLSDYYAPPRRGGGGIRRSSASVVHPSVCLSDVAYIGSNSKTKRPRKTKLCTGVPQVTCDSHTDFKVKSQGHGAEAYCGSHLAAQLHSGTTNRAATWRTAADITSLKYYLILQCL